MYRILMLASLVSLGLAAFDGREARAESPKFELMPIFPADKKHNHSSCIIETKAGDLFAVWYAGSGERKSDDVVIQGAWKPKGAKAWSPRFLLADTPGYPDCNPAIFQAPDSAIWLFWPTILDHNWEGALLKFGKSVKSPGPEGPLKWEREGVVHITPVGFAKDMEEAYKSLTEADKAKFPDDIKVIMQRSKDELYQRLGWMPRVHPVVLPSGRWLLPLYTDTYSVSLMGISDDEGKTWKASKPMIGWGNIQPAIVRKKDGTLVAYMRENGVTEHIRMSESKDDGMTWSPVTSTEFANPGAGVDVVGLSDGNWVLIYNDSAKGRHTLAVSLSDDEGKTWKWTRHIEKVEKDRGSFHYPSITQGADGTIHASYTWNKPKQGSSIHHAAFNEAWIREGDPK